MAVPKTQGKRGASKYNYAAAGTVYIEGSVNDKGERSYKTLGEVAELFEIPANRIRERAAREGWTDKRAAFQAHMEKVRLEKRATDLAKEAVEVDSQALKIGKLGVQLVTSRMGEMAQELGKRTKAKKAYEDALAAGADAATLAEIDYDPWAPHPVDVRELQALAQTATIWHSLSMKALGEVETTRHEITGPGGRPIQTESKISQELVRDDTSRVHALLIAVRRSSIAGTEARGGVAAGSPELAQLRARAHDGGHPAAGPEPEA